MTVGSAIDGRRRRPHARAVHRLERAAPAGRRLYPGVTAVAVCGRQLEAHVDTDAAVTCRACHAATGRAVRRAAA